MGCCFTDAACCLLSLRGLGKGSCCMQGGISLGGVGNVALGGLEGCSLCRQAWSMLLRRGGELFLRLQGEGGAWGRARMKGADRGDR